MSAEDEADGFYSAKTNVVSDWNLGKTRSQSNTKDDDELFENLNLECLKDILKQRSNRGGKYGLRPRKRSICYTEVDEPPFDEYLWCMECKDFQYEYCSTHLPPLVVLDTKPPKNADFTTFPRAMYTLPTPFLQIRPSSIKGAGLGVFANLAMPQDVTFGPYRGVKKLETSTFGYSWQVQGKGRKPMYLLDAGDKNRSNWMRYVNCARCAQEQNVFAYQFKGHIFYRTMKNIPRHNELLVFYGAEFAIQLGINVAFYNVIPEPLLRDDCDPELRKTLTLEYRKANKAKGIKIKEIPDTSNKKIKTKDSLAIVKIKFTPPVKKTNIMTETVETCEVDSNEGLSNDENTNVPSTAQNNNTTELVSEASQRKATPNDSIEKAQHEVEASKGVSPTSLTTKTSGLTSSVIEKKFECDVCHKKLSSRYYLNDHLSLMHRNDARYECTHCNKRFTLNANLKNHIRIHTQEKPFVCTYCNKGFSRAHYLKTHLRTHTNEKPFICTHCNKGCTTSSHLKRHSRVHTGEKPYKCTVCDKAFADGSNLRVHLKKHN